MLPFCSFQAFFFSFFPRSFFKSAIFPLLFNHPKAISSSLSLSHPQTDHQPQHSQPHRRVSNMKAPLFLFSFLFFSSTKVTFSLRGKSDSSREGGRGKRMLLAMMELCAAAALSLTHCTVHVVNYHF